MSSNTTRNSPRNTRPAPATPRQAKLSQRGVLVVALTVGGLVIAAGNGYAGQAALLGYALYLLVSGKGSTLARKMPDPRNAFRALCWAVVAVTAFAALQGTTAPGGSTFGLALAAALAVALRLTGRRTRRNTH